MDDDSAPRKTLIPGYRHVESFGPDEEYESGEEEVEYVTLDLGTVEPTLVPSSSTYRLIGLDTPTPFLQLSGTVFKGEHRELLGTELIFKDGEEEDGQPARALTHVANTEKRVRFRQVELVPKAASSSSADAAPHDKRDDAVGSGKGRGKGKMREYEVQQEWTEADFNLVDQAIGIAEPEEAPRRRRKRKRKNAGSEKGKEKDESEGHVGGAAAESEQGVASGMQDVTEDVSMTETEAIPIDPSLMDTEDG